MSFSPDMKESIRKHFYAEIGVHNLAPLWQKLNVLVPQTPSTPALPAKWDYDGIVREHVFRSGEIVTAEEAERRVLILENPGLTGQASITHSLYAGLQLVRPGEVARAHRHSQSALRFVIEGSGAYTTVDGERVIMQPGDFVLTPSWRWHDHGNESSEPMVWLDGLDIPMLSFFDAGFAETSRVESQDSLRPSGHSSLRFGHNMLPVDWRAGDLSSPILNYPYERSREVLDGLEKGEDPDPCHGHKLRFVNPGSGDWPMPTIAAFIQRFPAGFETRPYRATDGTIFVVIEGEGESQIGDVTFQWKPRDIFVAPSWYQLVHRCRSTATLFSFSDRAVQEKLGMWKELRLVAEDGR